MNWRDQLQEASYEGIKFKVTSDIVTGVGRRKVFHQVPYQSTPVVDDLGEDNKTFNINGYLIGEDYLDTLQKLSEALHKKGPGQLIHPYFGTREVEASAVSINHNSNEGGYCTFTLNCIIATKAKYSASSLVFKQNVAEAVAQSNQAISQILAENVMPPSNTQQSVQAESDMQSIIDAIETENPIQNALSISADADKKLKEEQLFAASNITSFVPALEKTIEQTLLIDQAEQVLTLIAQLEAVRAQSLSALNGRFLKYGALGVLYNKLASISAEKEIQNIEEGEALKETIVNWGDIVASEQAQTSRLANQEANNINLDPAVQGNTQTVRLAAARAIEEQIQRLKDQGGTISKRYHNQTIAFIAFDLTGDIANSNRIAEINQLVNPANVSGVISYYP